MGTGTVGRYLPYYNYYGTYHLVYLVVQEEEKRLWREQHPDSESEESEAEAEVKTRGGRGGARGEAASAKRVRIFIPFAPLDPDLCIRYVGPYPAW